MSWLDLLVLGGIAVAGYALVVWVFNMVQWNRSPSRDQPADRRDDGVQPLEACPNADCRALNPVGAQYCGRCGQRLA